MWPPRELLLSWCISTFGFRTFLTSDTTSERFFFFFKSRLVVKLRSSHLYITDNENQVQHNLCLISHNAYTQTETLTIIKVAQIAAIFPARRIINLPCISFWSCWRFLGWWTRSCIFIGSLLPITVKRIAIKKIALNQRHL